jgi:HdeA/HdeB family
MANVKMVVAALALAAGIASPVLAEDFTPVDVKSVTCSDFLGMDALGKDDVSYHVLKWIDDQANAVEARQLIEKYTPANSEDHWLPPKLTIEIEGHCADGAPDIGIIDRLMEHT